MTNLELLVWFGLALAGQTASYVVRSHRPGSQNLSVKQKCFQEVIQGKVMPPDRLSPVGQPARCVPVNHMQPRQTALQHSCPRLVFMHLLVNSVFYWEE